MIVRARHDRATVGGTALFAAPEAFGLLGMASVHVPPHGPGDKGRIAEVSIKAGRVEIVRPRKLRAVSGAPAAITLRLVEIAEVSPPPGTKPLTWRLLTTLPVATLGQGHRGREALPAASCRRRALARGASSSCSAR